MRLSVQTITALCQIITGDTELSSYRSGPDLVKFFNQFGWEDEYGRGFPARWKYAEDKAFELNDTPLMVQLVEETVDPRHFLGTNSSVEDVVSHLNQYLQYDGYKLVKEGLNYKIHRLSGGRFAATKVKNLIFASNGPKPEIILADAINNDIEIVKNAEYCLVYDEDIAADGLPWLRLVEWWAEKNSLPFPSDKAEFALHKRLEQSLQSPPEHLLFSVYFKQFRRRIGVNLPALIPQVYLHYDPKTLKELQYKKRLKRQRMDFLILFPNYERVVIEIDGKHHYANGDIADPKRYTELVSADRDLRLAGYEIYRFGGYELSKTDASNLLTNFFEQIFAIYDIPLEKDTLE